MNAPVRFKFVVNCSHVLKGFMMSQPMTEANFSPEQPKFSCSAATMLRHTWSSRTPPGSMPDDENGSFLSPGELRSDSQSDEESPLDQEPAVFWRFTRSDAEVCVPFGSVAERATDRHGDADEKAVFFVPASFADSDLINFLCRGRKYLRVL